MSYFAIVECENIKKVVEIVDFQNEHYIDTQNRKYSEIEKIDNSGLDDNWENLLTNKMRNAIACHVWNENGEKYRELVYNKKDGIRPYITYNGFYKYAEPIINK